MNTSQRSLFEPNEVVRVDPPRPWPTPPAEPDVCARKHGGDLNSKLAHGHLLPHKAEQREKVRRYVASCCGHGATCDETAEFLGLFPNDISGRFRELERDGKIKRNGERRTTRRGNWAWVWIATAEGSCRE